jgi:hypothetical protein
LLFHVDRPFVAFGSHRLASRTLRQATLAIPDLAPMSLLRDVAIPSLRLVDGDAHLLELEFDDARDDIDLRPTLPLRLQL